MTIQSTQCAAEELAELEEWLRSKGLELVDKDAEELEAGEYARTMAEPKDSTSSESPTWTVSWHPKEDSPS